jgi:hypothetical protein
MKHDGKHDGWAPLIARQSDVGTRLWEIVCAIADERSGAEMALLDAYLFLADGDGQRLQRAVKRLNAAIADVDALCSTGRWGLQGGLAGLGWITEHISQIRDGRGAGDLNADTDAALLRELERGRWRGSCDLESGLAGIGIYFLERLPSPGAAAAGSLVVAHLESLVPWEPRGVMHFLLAAVACGIETEKARRMLDDSVVRVEQSGTVDAAAVLLEMGQRAAGLRVLERCLHSTPVDDSVAAHAFNRLFQRVGDARCREKALSFIERALSNLQRTPDVALTLLAAITPIEPAWDRRIGWSRLEYR